MTHRERFRRAAGHQPVDRAVYDLCGSPQTMIDSPALRRELERLLGVASPGGGAPLQEGVLERLDIDTRQVGGMPTPATVHNRVENGVRYDSYGIGYRLMGDHEEICHNPLRDTSLDEMLAWPMPRAEDVDRGLVARWAAEAETLHRETDYAVVAGHPVLGVFELGCWMFGFDDYLYRLAAEPELVHAFSRRVLAYQKEVITLYYGALGRYIDCTTSGDDFGTQTGPFMSAEMFDGLIRPYLQERVAHTKRYTDAFYQHHTCGSVYALLPGLIACGIDILNPIQPGTYQMDPEGLKRQYGDRMSFWGGVDTQDLLVNQPPEAVKAEVARLLAILGRDGGYILSPAHCLQADVPAENVLAIYEGAREYYESRA